MAKRHPINERTNGQGRLYLTMVSTETSLAFFAVFVLLFFLGSIFPQDFNLDGLEQYREIGGKLARLAETLGFLNLFRSWYFILITALFALHLVVCCVHKLLLLHRRLPARRFKREDLLPLSFFSGRSDRFHRY